MIQLFCGFEDPDIVVPTLINRWSMSDWCSGRIFLSGMASSHMQEMVEEFLLFLINILNEDLHLHKRSLGEIQDLKIKREIIQALCFKPLPYSEMLSMISDNISSERRFFIIFKQCTEEVATPHHSKESKIYRLKEKLFREVDPYYVHYTSNKREDCIKVLKQRIHDQLKIPLEDVFLTPRKINWEDSPFASLVQITCSNGFMSILETTLSYCLKPAGIEKVASNVDGLIELVISLIHIAVELPNFSNFINNHLRHSSVPSKLYDLLNKEDQFRDVYPKIKEILRVVCHCLSFDGDAINSMIPGFNSNLIIPASQHMEDHSNDKKKKLAKKKKNKILASLKKQQQKFAENYMLENSDIMDIDDEEEMEVIDDNSWQFPQHHCIVCQMPASSEDEPFGIVSHILESNEFRTVPHDDPYWFYQAFGGDSNLDEVVKVKSGKIEHYLKQVEEDAVIGPGFPGNQQPCSDNHSVLTSCGHGMHYSCFLGYLESIKPRQP
ncbi:unnamed protein product [Ambrosiozyma monospora]|uniref:Unnamed protein product n=1 Tax=Ambrosiozyma monospora TaxID=43982 RepID=A0ACB5TKH3_AMBMO|nr:unnamed protein product [Ambrosiozyma monospora]